MCAGNIAVSDMFHDPLISFLSLRELVPVASNVWYLGVLHKVIRFIEVLAQGKVEGPVRVSVLHKCSFSFLNGSVKSFSV